MSQHTLRYHRGRLVLPPELLDAAPSAVAEWLSCVPEAERGRAFRAMPLNLGAAAFLHLPPTDRAALLACLNQANIRYLTGIAPDTLLHETLNHADPETNARIRLALPDWRLKRMQDMDSQLMTRQPEPKPPETGRVPWGWLRRTIGRARV